MFVAIFPDTTMFGFPVDGLNNDNAGIRVLNHFGQVVDFVSWEGAFTVDGQLSQQLTSGNGDSAGPVQQNASADPDKSLQQSGFGAWTFNVPQSVGMVNTSHPDIGVQGNIIHCMSGTIQPMEMVLTLLQEAHGPMVQVGHSKKI